MSPGEIPISEVRSALGSLNDPVRLEQHPLAGRISFIAQAPGVSQGQALARVLRRAIVALEPGPGVPPSAPEARPYQILRRHYIAGQTMSRIALELDIGERHGYRELRSAVEALARVIAQWAETADEEAASDSGDPAHANGIRREVERLSSANCQDVDLRQLLSDAIASIRPLADANDIDVALHCALSLHVAAPRVLLRQAMLNLLSHLVRVHCGRSLLVHVHGTAQDAVVRFHCLLESPATDLAPEQPYGIAVQLLASLGLQLEREDRLSDRSTLLSIRVPLAEQHAVLIVDDNQALIRLFRRYLRHQRYVVYGVADEGEALAALERFRPEVIILDVMMPDRDGWEVLQSLRRTEPGRQARVIICSVISDPQLAQALGADAFLHKPVDQITLLETLDRVLAIQA